MMKKYFLLILFSFVCGASISQSKIVKGSVQDAESGEQLVGVAVKLFGVDRGVITDYDGNYQVTVPDDIDQLVFSYIGYKTLTVSIGKRSIINVSLSIDVTELDEVVVVGYGQIRKSDITGAVASVKSEDLVKAPTSNAIDALQERWQAFQY
jgi:hypothetical protein